MPEISKDLLRDTHSLSHYHEFAERHAFTVYRDPESEISGRHTTSNNGSEIANWYENKAEISSTSERTDLAISIFGVSRISIS